MTDVEVFCPLYAWLTLYILNYYDLQLLWAMIEVLCIKERSFIFLLLGTTGLLIMLGVGSFWSNVWRSVFLTYKLIVALNYIFLAFSGARSSLHMMPSVCSYCYTKALF